MKNAYTKLSLIVLAMFIAVACTSKKYDLENINTEITLGGEGIVAPIGYIDTLTLHPELAQILLVAVLLGGSGTFRRAGCSKKTAFTVYSFE